MNLFFFGASDRPLLGAYGPPQSSGSGEEAILLCPPIGHEYQRSHWAFRLLFRHLARAGYHVFLFDYSGQGDSWGSFTDASMGQWRADIQAAAHELLANAGLSRLSLVGLRLGAALAWQAARELPVDNLVLWDPVIQGRDYLDELSRLEMGQRRLKPWARPAPAPAENEELLGFPYSPRFVNEITLLDLTVETIPPVGSIHLLTSANRPEYQQFYHHLEKAGMNVTQQTIPEPGDWDAPGLFVEQLTIGSVPSLIVKALAGKGV